MALVEIYYGPYWQNHVLRYKTQRLHSITQSLTKLGFDVELLPSPHLERVTVIMKDREIFQCNITHLRFNLDCKNDTICNRLVEAVLEAREYLYSPKNIENHSPVSTGKKLLDEIKNVRTIHNFYGMRNVSTWFQMQEDSFMKPQYN